MNTVWTDTFCIESLNETKDKLNKETSKLKKNVEKTKLHCLKK